MKINLVDLKRELFEVDGPDWTANSADLARVTGKYRSWEDVLEERCIILFGPANSGKTSELRLQAKLLRKAGRHACFVAMRELLHDGPLEDALEREEAAALQAWSKEQHQRVFIFVDALDEAAASSPRHVRNSIRRLAAETKHAPGSVSWVLSTRPAVLNLEVVAAIEDALGIRVPKVHSDDERDLEIDDASDSRRSTSVEKPDEGPAARIFRLAPLSRAQAEGFLSKVSDISKPSELCESAEAHGLGYLLRSPGSCRLLTRLGLQQTPPNSLVEVFTRVADALVDSATRNKQEVFRASKEQVDVEAYRLACASTLCEKLNIELPSSSDEPSSNALSARTVIRGLLDSELLCLLNCELFEDSGHQQVKLQPDDVRFLLAAKRLDKLILGKEDASKIASVLGWRAPSGEHGVFVPYIPLAGWLSTLNAHFRQECLALDPQCVAFFGDLRSLPLPEAQTALSRAIAQVAEGQRIGHGAYNLTTENYWQAGAPELLPLLGTLFERHKESSGAREVLIDIARTVRSPILRDKLFCWVDSSYSRILADPDMLAYFLVAGTSTDRVKLRTTAMRARTLSELSLRVLLEQGGLSLLSAKDVGSLVAKVQRQGGRMFMLSFVLRNDLAPTADATTLVQLTKELQKLLWSCLRPDNEDQFHERLEDCEWLAEVLIDLYATLVDRRLSKQQLQDVAGSIVDLAVSVLAKDYGNVVNHKSLSTKLELPSEVRSEVVARLARATVSLDEGMLWRMFFARKPLLLPRVEEVSPHGAPLLRNALEQHEASLERGRLQRPEASPRPVATADERTTSVLLSRLEGIASGKDVGALCWAAQRLSRTTSMARHGEVDIARFQDVYGQTIAEAVRGGLQKLWRNKAPKRSEDDPRSTYWSTIAGLQGLALELASPDVGEPFSKVELRRALDYGLYEINGLPFWFWRLAATDLEESARFLRKVLKDMNKGAVSRERAGTVLTSLRDAPHELQIELAKDAWTSVCGGDWDEYQTSAVLSLLVERKLIAVDLFNQEARRRVLSSQKLRSRPVWAVNWLLYDAPVFLEALDSLKKDTPDQADELISSVATELEDGRGRALEELSKRDARVIRALKTLYTELHRVLPAKHDRKYPDGKIHRIDERDRAQRTRDKIPGLLAASRNAAGYAALKELLSDASTEGERLYFIALMRQTAEAMLRPSRAMTEDDFLEFERSLQRTPGSLEAFALQVENDVLEVKEFIETSEFSPRRFLATSVQDIEEGRVKAMEDEFQLYLAGMLAVKGQRRYSVFREPQGADDTRRDISVAAPSQAWKATLELKVTAGNWTLPDYRNSLRDQLVGLYMRERHTTVGFFVVLKQSTRQWEGEDGRLVDFNELLGVLRRDALDIEAKQPHLRLRVIGIDATEPLDSEGKPVRAKAAPKKAKVGKKAVGQDASVASTGT